MLLILKRILLYLVYSLYISIKQLIFRFDYVFNRMIIIFKKDNRERLYHQLCKANLRTTWKSWDYVNKVRRKKMTSKLFSGFSDFQSHLKPLFRSKKRQKREKSVQKITIRFCLLLFTYVIIKMSCFTK